MPLIAFDSMGQVVKPGESVVSFRGDVATLVRPTRARTNEKSGKVVVKWEGFNSPELEYYDKVFDLHIKDIPN